MSYDLKIMMVDDNDSCNYYHKIMMEEAGINIDNLYEFNTVNDALQYLKTHSISEYNALPDVILLDINMPQKNGWDFIETLKSFKLKDNLPRIYLVSNSRHPLDIKRAIKNPLVYELKEKHLELEFFKALKLEFITTPKQANEN